MREEREKGSYRYYCLICFSREEATEYVEIGSLNGLFVLGRTLGFIGKSYKRVVCDQ